MGFTLEMQHASEDGELLPLFWGFGELLVSSFITVISPGLSAAGRPPFKPEGALNDCTNLMHRIRPNGRLETDRIFCAGQSSNIS
jgi:hypothetical protein